MSIFAGQYGRQDSMSQLVRYMYWQFPGSLVELANPAAAHGEQIIRPRICCTERSCRGLECPYTLAFAGHYVEGALLPSADLARIGPLKVQFADLSAHLSERDKRSGIRLCVSTEHRLHRQQ